MNTLGMGPLWYLGRPYLKLCEPLCLSIHISSNMVQVDKDSAQERYPFRACRGALATDWHSRHRNANEVYL